MDFAHRQVVIGLLTIPAVVIPTVAGAALGGPGLGLVFGLAAVVGLLAYDTTRRTPAPSGRALGERAEMSTKQIIATGGATVSSVGIVGLIKQDVIGGLVYAVVYFVVGIFNGLGSTVSGPLTALLNGVSGIISSALTGRLLDAGYRVAAEAIAKYGTVAPVVAAVVTMVVAAVLYVSFQRMDFSPFQLLYDKLP